MQTKLGRRLQVCILKLIKKEMCHFAYRGRYSKLITSSSQTLYLPLFLRVISPTFLAPHRHARPQNVRLIDESPAMTLLSDSSNGLGAIRDQAQVFFPFT